jgi:hypothetical protein
MKTRLIQHFIKGKAVTKREFSLEQKSQLLSKCVSRKALIQNKVFTESQIRRLVDSGVLTPKKYRAQVYFDYQEIKKGVNLLFNSKPTQARLDLF